MKKISLEETIKYCLNTPEFMEQYKRLNGWTCRSAMDRLVDEATGYEKAKAYELFNFIRDYIWIPSQFPELLKKN